MKIIESYLTKNRCYQAGKAIIAKGLMHSAVGAINECMDAG